MSAGAVTPVLFLIALVSVAAGAPPAGAQTPPRCGSAQMEPRLYLPSALYPGRRYVSPIRFQAGAGVDAEVENVRLAGPPGQVTLSGDDDDWRVTLTPVAQGPLSATVSWEQVPYPRQLPRCAASFALDLQVAAAMPVTIDPYRRGTSAYVRSWPCGGASTCRGARANRFGIHLRLGVGTFDRSDPLGLGGVDLTPVRVEARAVPRATRPSPAVESAVLEFIPGTRQPRRARSGLMEIVRPGPHGDPYEALDLWVAIRPGLVRRGVGFSISQGTRLIGSFAATGRCRLVSSLGVPMTDCDFAGKHAWLWAPCRPVSTKGRFIGCRSS